MREILFKAKRVDDGEWVEGYYVKGATRHCILKHLGGYPKYDIDEKTICQYTGLTDKNGKKIWENDIVESTYDDTYEGIDCGIGLVEFFQGLWYVGGDVQNALYDIDKCNAVEVIGNIFDNPELLESGADDEMH